ncbi:hypothetical protein [Chitinolyticbacter albus]|uniref:hypothetical protein n=1 Tax=Chitinolyticbacter albus TaxID=2961951 RepID=UPI0021097506|nr:hypothetical protein [Chitinolyticbacter albus]
MFLNALRFGGITGLWWALVWYVLPIDLRQLSVPSLVLLHIGPPLLFSAAWSVFKRVRTSRAAKAAEAAAAAQAAEQQAKVDAAKAAHEAELKRRRTHVECRAVWSAMPKVPDWHEGDPAQCLMLEQDQAEVAGVGREAALAPSLQQVFEAALLQSEAVAWLPIHVLPGRDLDGVTQLELVKQAWQQAVVACGIEQVPAQPDCKFLPGSEQVADRVIALFENDPSLPAMVLLGLDSPLGDEPEDDDFADEPDAETLALRRHIGKPGHAVAAVLLSRPGLVTFVDPDAGLAERNSDDPYTPYWEQDHGREASSAQWGRVPPPLQPGLVAMAPFAALHQSRSAYRQGGLDKGNVLARQIQSLVEGVLVNATLRDLPFDSSEAKEAEPLELGWLVHNSGGVDVGGIRLAAIASALHYFGCEINPVDEASNLVVEHGDVGAARSVLLLAEALIRVAQLQKPVLVAEFDGNDSIGIGLMRPVTEGA